MIIEDRLEAEDKVITAISAFVTPMRLPLNPEDVELIAGVIIKALDENMPDRSITDLAKKEFAKLVEGHHKMTGAI